MIQINKTAVVLIAIIFAGIVFHAPFTVVMSTLYPDVSLVFKAWKEILLFLLVVITSFVVIHDGYSRKILHDKIILFILLYCILHIILLLLFPHNTLALVSGLMIDLRYVIFFLIVYIWVLRYEQLKPYIILIATIGAFIVCGFAFLQTFILPHDVLSYIGYNKNTIIPYLLVDGNHDFIRINSTLRGPNPLGAYSLLVISCVYAFILIKKSLSSSQRILAYLLLTFSSMSLWASYSRGALIGAIISLILISAIYFLPLLTKKFIIFFTAAVLAIIYIVAINASNYFISNILLHDNPASASRSHSNVQHIESLKEGSERLITQPLGAGVGSTGSASLFTPSPFIIENQYLFIAHESGWMGLVIFLLIIFYVLKKLWKYRSDWLSLGLFASGIGLCLIGIVLPVWNDETVALVWWGLAGLVIAQNHSKAIVLRQDK